MSGLLTAGLWWFWKQRASAATQSGAAVEVGAREESSPPVRQPSPPFMPSTPLSVGQAIQLASYFERTEFAGWFAANGYSVADIVAMWQTESGLDPRAVGDNGNAFGLGQNWAPSAREVGFPDVTALLVAENGALASMRYLKLVHRWIVSRADSPYRQRGEVHPPFTDLLWAYNAGIGNYWKGVLPASTRNVHIPRWGRYRSVL